MTLVPEQRIDEETEAVPEVIWFTREEWREWVLSGVAELGLTWEELQAQAREEDFVSWDAEKMWMMYGGTL
ncbi:hypothetical protein [Actinoplanes sp. RD1]|uniref:hypothetical protein n=1 Tax=Actinoplanes sp. RD1 TaxID=3064538 RepID=UPI0027419408|nr:hypothetical protein [Actinoplanes sp. RD1]